MKEESRSAFTCDACHGIAVYYSNKGIYNISNRCLKHVPTGIKVTLEETYNNSTNKYWVICGKGISLSMQKKVDEALSNTQPKKKNKWITMEKIEGTR